METYSKIRPSHVVESTTVSGIRDAQAMHLERLMENSKAGDRITDPRTRRGGADGFAQVAFVVQEPQSQRKFVDVREGRWQQKHVDAMHSCPLWCATAERTFEHVV